MQYLQFSTLPDDDPIVGGHPGQKRLYAKVAANFYCKNMRQYIAKYVQNCHKCIVNKVKSTNKEPMFLPCYMLLIKIKLCTFLSFLYSNYVRFSHFRIKIFSIIKLIRIYIHCFTLFVFHGAIFLKLMYILIC